MRTIEKQVYTYDELSEDVKKKLLEEQKERESENYCEMFLYDDMREEGNRLVKEYFGCERADEVYYDLSYRQGSGAMIEFTINFKDLNNKYHILNDEEMRYVEDKGIVNEIEVRHNDNMYYHEYTFNVDYYDDFGVWDYEDIKDDYNITEDDFDTIEDRIIKLLNSCGKHNTESDFIKDIIKMNTELKDYGYDVIEQPVDDSVVLEYLREYEFYENGEIYF